MASSAAANSAAAAAAVRAHRYRVAVVSADMLCTSERERERDTVKERCGVVACFHSLCVRCYSRVGFAFDTRRVGHEWPLALCVTCDIYSERDG